LFLPHDPFGLETMKPMVEEKKDKIQPFGLLGGKNNHINIGLLEKGHNP
jgi:hypothetical protein